MATGQYLSLIDLARRTDPDGESADIAELLSEANEIYDDLVWKEGNTNTGHVYTIRTSIPKGWWRFINQGVPGSKSTTAQGRTNCGDLQMNSTIDLRLIEMAGNRNQFRYEEDNSVLEGASPPAVALVTSRLQIRNAQRQSSTHSPAIWRNHVILAW